MQTTTKFNTWHCILFNVTFTKDQFAVLIVRVLWTYLKQALARSTYQCSASYSTAYSSSLTRHRQVAQATELLYESLNSMNTTCAERYVLSNMCCISMKGSKCSSNMTEVLLSLLSFDIVIDSDHWIVSFGQVFNGCPGILWKATF